jgi:ATP-dependent helicase Lhr and Lhr-like helicase
VFPFLSRAAREGWTGLSVLYICPLKALLNNLEPRVARYTSFVGQRAALWHGDIGEAARRRIRKDLPDVLLTTPESIEAILISARLDHRSVLSSVRAVVVDEMHAFAGDDRGWHLLAILARIEHLAGRHLQRIGLSATVGNPEDLLRWLTQTRGGRVVGAGGGPPDGDVTADYAGSVANAIICFPVCTAASGGSFSPTAARGSKNLQLGSAQPASERSPRMAPCQSMSAVRPKLPLPQTRTASSSPRRP